MTPLIALLLQAAPVVPPLHGGPADTVCPIGGEHFQAFQPGSYSTYGSRPDGKPYSYLPFPFALPECPSNHLIVFGTFSDADKAALAPLIASETYRRLAGEAQYYRAWWLATRIGRPVDALDLLLQAIWEVTPGDLAGPGDAAKAKAYRTAFIDGVVQLPATTSADDRLWLTARAANAARELGRFDEAERLRLRAVGLLAGVADKKGWDDYLAKLAKVIARRDPGIEPLDMVPPQQIALVCKYRLPANAFDRAACAAHPLTD